MGVLFLSPHLFFNKLSRIQDKDWSAIAFVSVNLSPQCLLLSKNVVAEIAIAFCIRIVLQIIIYPVAAS